MMEHGVVPKAAKNHASDLRTIVKPRRDSGNRNLGCSGRGKTIDSGRYSRKRDRADAVGLRQGQRIVVGRCQKPVLIGIAALPDRADRMDDVARFQAITGGEFRLTRGAAAEAPAFRQQFRPGGVVDGTVDTAAAKQGRIRRVDDRVDIERRDVSLDNLDPLTHAKAPPPDLPCPDRWRTGRAERLRVAPALRDDIYLRP